MQPRRITRLVGVLAAGMIGLLAQSGPRANAADAAAPNGESGVEVLTRGPIHEAFAEPNSYNPTPGVVVSMAAPALIEEIPPDQKPSGDALWIPGYWQWDSERPDFIWISGIWRVPPPGCSWVPGYWTAVDNGSTWTPGFWLASAADEVSYLPQPPKSLEVGPSSPAPSADFIWAAGCWAWTDARYAWRPGYWVQARPDWVWSPAYYVDTPRGSVFIDGYWDYTIDRRGVLFAPAYIQRSLRERADYVYSPSIVLQTELLTAQLFISPRYGHYYFGDYYDSHYASGGIYPWFEYQKKHHGYDPIYAHERWSQSRTDNQWEQHVRENYDNRMKHSEARPPRLYSEQAAFAARASEKDRKYATIAAPLSEFTQRSNTPMHYEKINDDQRKSFGGQGKDLAKYRDQRAQWETTGNQAGKGKPAQAGPPKHQVNTASPEELSKKLGKDQPGQSSPEPGKVQSKHESKRPNVAQVAQLPGKEKTYKAPKISEPQKQKIPRSPVVGKAPEAANQKDNPPNRPEAPKANSDNHGKANNKDNAKHETTAKHEAPTAHASAPADHNDQGKSDKGGNRDKGGKGDTNDKSGKN